MPEVGQVTENVAMSPTELANGEYEFTKQVAVYEGLVEDTVPEVGTTTTVASVLNNGNSVASIEAAPKSCMNESVTEPDFRPPTRDLHSDPKAVISKSSDSNANSTLFKFVEKLLPLIVIL